MYGARTCDRLHPDSAVPIGTIRDVGGRGKLYFATVALITDLRHASGSHTRQSYPTTALRQPGAWLGAHILGSLQGAAPPNSNHD